MKIQIKNRYNGSIIFEHECENNSIKETLIQSIKKDAYLRGADLRGADLQDAYLRGADLQDADLRGAYLRGADIPIFSKWHVSIIDNKIIKIGCKKMTIEEWDLFFASEEEFETKRGTQEFKQIQAMYLAHKAYLTHLNN